MLKDIELIREQIKNAKLELLDPAGLRPHPENDFRHVSGAEWEKFKKSIKEMGVIHPAIVDVRGQVLSGEQRRRACLELDMKLPAYRVPLVSKETARHIVVVVNLASRRMPAEEFNKYWMELYGEEAAKLIESGASKNAVVQKLASKSGLSERVVLRRVETVIHEKLKQKYSSIDKLDQIPPAKRSRLKALAKRASGVIDRIDILKEEYLAIRKEMAGIVRLEIVALPDLQIQFQEDGLSSLTGTRKLTVNKQKRHLGGRKK